MSKLTEAPQPDCPFDTRLARTAYLVIPKLALQAMPLWWRDQLEGLLVKADEVGLETPAYHVLREDPIYTLVTLAGEYEHSGIECLEVLRADPWANYRHGDAEILCPGFRAARDGHDD